MPRDAHERMSLKERLRINHLNVTLMYAEVTRETQITARVILSPLPVPVGNNQFFSQGQFIPSSPSDSLRDSSFSPPPHAPPFFLPQRWPS